MAQTLSPLVRTSNLKWALEHDLLPSAARRIVAHYGQDPDGVCVHHFKGRVICRFVLRGGEYGVCYTLRPAFNLQGIVLRAELTLQRDRLEKGKRVTPNLLKKLDKTPGEITDTDLEEDFECLYTKLVALLPTEYHSLVPTPRRGGQP